MPTVDATNSYITETEASAYMDQRLHVAPWTGADAIDQQKALIMSRRLLDNYVPWDGEKADPHQGLQWPRVGVGIETVPQIIKDAQAELALIILKEDVTALPDGRGLVRQKIDVIESVYDTSNRPGVIPETILDMVRPYIKGEHTLLATR